MKVSRFGSLCLLMIIFFTTSSYATASVNIPIPHSIRTSENFLLSSRVAIEYDKDEDEFYFSEWGYMWSEKKITINQCLISFLYKPSADILKDKDGKIYLPELHFFISENLREKGDHIDKLGNYVSIKFPVTEKPAYIRSKAGGSIVESSESGKDLFSINEWSEIRILVENDSIRLYINGNLALVKNNVNIPTKSHIGFESWSSSDWRIKNAQIITFAPNR